MMRGSVRGPEARITDHASRITIPHAPRVSQGAGMRRSKETMTEADA
jgi:hypothetical protein